MRKILLMFPLSIVLLTFLTGCQKTIPYEDTEPYKVVAQKEIKEFYDTKGFQDVSEQIVSNSLYEGNRIPTEKYYFSITDYN